MDEGQIKGIIENEIDNSIGYIDTETTDQRSKALEYYLRYPYGNEVEGRSQIVTGEVAEAIDGALPQLIRVFTTTEDIVSFEPQTPEDEESAKQATDTEDPQSGLEYEVCQSTVNNVTTVSVPSNRLAVERRRWTIDGKIHNANKIKLKVACVD